MVRIMLISEDKGGSGSKIYLSITDTSYIGANDHQLKYSNLCVMWAQNNESITCANVNSM